MGAREREGGSHSILGSQLDLMMMMMSLDVVCETLNNVFLIEKHTKCIIQPKLLGRSSIRRLDHCRGIGYPVNKSPGYHFKHPDEEAPRGPGKQL